MNQSLNDTLTEALCTAASKGDADAARRLIAAGANPHARVRTGYNALSGAMVHGHIGTLRVLLESGFMPSADDVGTGLGRGCGIGARDSKVPLMELLLQYGFDPNGTRSREDGSTLLMCLLGHCEGAALVRLLLDHGADIHARDARGRTPFMYATELCFDENIRLLHERGADVNAQDKQGRTALMNMLCIYEDDWNKLSDRHHPIDFLEWEEDLDMCNEYGTRRAQLLLDCGVDIHVTTPCGWNALLLCLALGNAPTARLLLTHGASLAGLEPQTIARVRAFAHRNGYTETVAQLDALG